MTRTDKVKSRIIDLSFLSDYMMNIQCSLLQYRRTCLIKATQFGNLDSFESLISHGASVDRADLVSFYNEHKYRIQTYMIAIWKLSAWVHMTWIEATIHEGHRMTYTYERISLHIVSLKVLNKFMKIILLFFLNSTDEFEIVQYLKKKFTASIKTAKW